MLQVTDDRERVVSNAITLGRRYRRLLSALRRLVATDRRDDERAAGFRAVLAPAGIRPHPRVSAFDPAYLALATVLDAPPVTTDRRLAKLPGLPSTVEVP